MFIPIIPVVGSEGYMLIIYLLYIFLYYGVGLVVGGILLVGSY